MSPQRKKIIFFVILSFCFLFLLNKNIVYAQNQAEAPGLQGVDITKGSPSGFMETFCHITEDKGSGAHWWNLWGLGSWIINKIESVDFLGITKAILNLTNLLWCLVLYAITLPIRLPLWAIVMFLWILVWLMAVLGSLVNNLFVVIIGASLITNNLNPEGMDLFNFTKAIGNGLVVLAGVVVGLATVLRIEEYSIRKHFGKLIALIVLVNYSHYIVVASATTANEIAKPFFDALKDKKEKGTLNIITNIWNKTNERQIAIELPYTSGEIFGGPAIHKLPMGLSTIPAVITDYLLFRNSYFILYLVPNIMLIMAVCIYLFLYFTIFFTLTCCFIYFALYGFIRIFMILILGILAPLAFSTIIFEKSRVYKVLFPGFLKWDNWLQSVLTWCFLVVPMLFMFFFGDQLYDAVDQFGLGDTLKKVTGELTTSKEGIIGSQYLSNAINQLLKLFADMTPVLAIVIFYAIAFGEIKNQIKELTSAIVSNIASGAWGLSGMTNLIGKGIGAAAVGVGTIAGAAGGLVAGLGAARAGSIISGIGQLPTKALSLAGAQGKKWSERAKKWGEKGEAMGTKVGRGVKSINWKETLKQGGAGIGGAMVFGGVGMAALGPLGGLIGTAIGGVLGQQLAKHGKKGIVEKTKIAAVQKRRQIGGTGGALGGALLGTQIGSFLGPLGAIGGGITGAVIGGMGGALLGEKFLKIKPSTPEDLRNSELDASNIECRDKSNEGLLTDMRKPTVPTTNKLRMALALAQRWGQLDKAQRETFNEELNNIEAQNTFNISDIALLEEIYPRTGREKPPAFEIKKREAAITSLQYEDALPMEKAAAVKILTDSDRPLSQEEVSLVSQALPYVQLDTDSAMKLALKAPSLAPQLGLSLSRVITTARINQENNTPTGKITDIPDYELPTVYNLLDEREKRMILEQGTDEQKAKMIDIMFKEFDIRLHHQYTIFLKDRGAQTANDKLVAASVFMLLPETRDNIKRIIQEKVAEIEDKEQKKELREEMNRMNNTIRDILNPYLRQRQNP